MARHSGKDGAATNGVNDLDGLVSWKLEENADIGEVTAAGEDWKTHVVKQKGWSGSITLRLDHAAGANQTIRAGDSGTLNLYSEGVGAGKTFFSGPVIYTGHSIDLSYDGEPAREYTFTGNGALSVSVVGA